MSRQNLDDIRYRVHESKTLGWADDDTAKDLLNRAIHYANRILANHHWSVMKATEFYPKDKRLLGLNINHGEHIKIRLRKPHNQREFFFFEEIMCTMLHEIVHNTISPHNKQFYALYYELVRECELLQVQDMQKRDGAVGVGGGMYGTAAGTSGGLVLGGASSGNKGSGGGRVLGGRNLGNGAAGQTNNYAAIRGNILAAAERRMKEAAEKAAAEGCCASQDDRLLAASLATGQHLDRSPSRFPPVAPPAPTWTCAVCSFVNHALLPYCEMCCANDEAQQLGMGDESIPPAGASVSNNTCCSQPADEEIDEVEILGTNGGVGGGSSAPNHDRHQQTPPSAGGGISPFAGSRTSSGRPSQSTALLGSNKSNPFVIDD